MWQNNIQVPWHVDWQNSTHTRYILMIVMNKHIQKAIAECRTKHYQTDQHTSYPQTNEPVKRKVAGEIKITSFFFFKRKFVSWQLKSFSLSHISSSSKVFVRKHVYACLYQTFCYIVLTHHFAPPVQKKSKCEVDSHSMQQKRPCLLHSHGIWNGSRSIKLVWT